jgi:hypothetical protein
MAVAICLLLSQIGLTGMFYCLRKDKGINLDKIIRQDCLMFDRTKITPNDYFLNNRRISVISNQVSPTQNNDLNTSRHLQDEKAVATIPNDFAAGDGNLKLKDNKNLNEIDNIELNKTAEYEKPNEKNIHIHNNFVDQKNASVELPKNFDVIPLSLTPTAVTMRDYESLSLVERVAYDNRSFSTYLWNNISRTNLLVSIFYKHSIIDPIHIRIAKLIFQISLIFGTNAILFTDYYIEQRANENDKVKNI